MRKWNFVLIGLLLLSLSRISAQTYNMTAPIGYGRAATGGGNATPTIVTNLTELKNALTASGSGVILIQGSIQVDYLSVLVTNKTILGLPGSKLFTNDQTSGASGILYFKPGTNNVIIRNLTFVGPGAYDSDGRDCLTFDGATNCWVDHCDFQDGMDGNFDNKGDADNITVSWCKFSYNKTPKPGGSGGTDDHRFTNLVGSGSSDFPADAQYSITWQNCWWAEGCVERMVRARNAQLHMLNCFWNSSVAKKGIGLEDGSGGKGTQCYVEGSVFETPSSTKNIDVSYGGTPDVTVIDCVGNGLADNSTTVAKPSYTYTALSSSAVEAAVTSACGAGATLNITTAGVISSACDNPTAPTLALTSGSNSQSVTVNTAISNIVYTYGGTATGVTVTGLPSGVSSAVNTTAKTVTISGTPTDVASNVAYTVSTVGGSPTVSLNGTITATAVVVPATLVLTSGSASQSVTVNTAISNIVYTYGGSATGATVTGLPSGVSFAVNTTAKTVTISGTPTSVQTATYTVSTVGESPTVTLTGTITSTAVPVITLAVPTNITASATQNSATINWDAVANATGYTVNFCSGTGSSDVVLLLNSTTATSTGVYTLNTGDQYKTTASISTSSACSPTGYTNTYRSSSINVNSLKLVNTTGVTKLTIGAKSSGSGARTLSSYSIDGGTAITTGIIQSGVATCGEYVIDGLNLTAGQEIAFVFDGNIQISYFIASAGTSSCTETAVTGTSFTANGLTENTSYTYQVKATNSNSGYVNSAYSAPATVTTNAVVINGTLALTTGSANQSIILGNAITPIVYTYGGSAIGATVTGLPSGVSYSVNTTAKTVTISGTPTSVGSVTYTVTTTQSSGNTATSVPQILEVLPLEVTWDGSVWSYGTGPMVSQEAIIAGNYSTTTNGVFPAKKLTVNSGVLTVASGTTLTIQNEVINNAAATALVVENNANLIQVNAATNTGAITVNRNSNTLKRLDYTLWSSPVSGTQRLYDFSPLTASSRFYVYKPGTTDVYETILNGNPFGKGKAYLIRMPNENATPGYNTGTTAITYNGVFTGTPNNGDVTLTNLEGIIANVFNGVGNPYPSTIDADLFLGANATTGTLYFFRKTNGVVNSNSSYATYTTLGGTQASNLAPNNEVPNGVIQVGQGFIVEPTTTTVSFTNSMRLGNNDNQFFRTRNVVEKNRVWLNLTNDAGAFSQTLVGYMTGATEAIDNGIDGKSINDAKVALTSNINNEDYTIQGRSLPFDASDVVSLNFKTDVAGDYTIAIDHADGLFASGQDVYLVDNVAGTETDLKAGGYTFTAPAGTANARFSLKYQKTLGVDAPAFNENSVTIYKNKGVLTVNSGNITIANVKVYDVQGKLLVELKNVKSTSATINNLKSTEQVLIVKVTAQDGTVITKKIIN